MKYANKMAASLVVTLMALPAATLVNAQAPSGNCNNNGDNHGTMQICPHTGLPHIAADALSNLKPLSLRVYIMPVDGGWSHKIARELRVALTNVGASVVMNVTNSFNPAPGGILVSFNHSDPEAVALFSALRRAGLDPVERSGATAPNQVYIEIGDPD